MKNWQKWWFSHIYVDLEILEDNCSLIFVSMINDRVYIAIWDTLVVPYSSGCVFNRL